MCTHIEQHDIANGEAPMEWWEGRCESEFHEVVPFLIFTPFSSGAVVRFFSMTGTITVAQNALQHPAHAVYGSI